MHFYPETKTLVLNGELEFCIEDEAHAIYQRLRRIAEDVGAAVEADITHGGYIKVYPAYGLTYYTLGVYENLDEKRFPIPGQYHVACVKAVSVVREVWFDNPTALAEISIPT